MSNIDNIMLLMKQFVIQYWFWRKLDDKDFEHEIITAKNAEEAIIKLKNLHRRIFAITIISETPL